MKYKRLIANMIDHILVSLITVIIVSFIVGSIIDNTQGGIGAIPFLIIIACFLPSCTSGYLLFWIMIATFQENLSNIDEISPYISVILTIIIIQTIVLSIAEISTNGSTIGRSGFKIKVISDNGKYTIGKALTRNFVKSVGKYIFYIPFISLLFNKTNKAFYDKLLKTSISEE